MIQLADKNSKEAIINIFKNSEDDICIINKFRISERNNYYKKQLNKNSKPEMKNLLRGLHSRIEIANEESLDLKTDLIQSGESVEKEAKMNRSSGA